MAFTVIFFVLIITMGELTMQGSAGGSAYMGDMTSTKKMAADAMQPVVGGGVP